MIITSNKSNNFPPLHMVGIASTEMQTSFPQLTEQIPKNSIVAENARKTGLDPEIEVPIPLAKNMAERVVGLISVVAPQVMGTGIPARIIELETKFGVLDWRVGFKIAEETAKEMFCKFETKLEAMEVGIRIGFAYLTLGIVSAPLEGFIGLKLKKRKDGKEYFSLQYAGPIRAAGGTAAATSVILGDYVRIKMGYAPYDPDPVEVSRYVMEIQDYHERVTNLQYFPSEEELKFMISHLPVEVDGDPTEDIEVSNYKDLPRVETNLIRGGVALVLAEGLTQKAPKLWKRLSKWGKDFELEWDWLAEFLKVKERIHSAHSVSTTVALTSATDAKKAAKTLQPNDTFIMDLVAGRPILTHPMATGGFRLRYGRGRTCGMYAVGLNPATLIVLDKFIAIGTQLKVERPRKGASATICDTVEGPIVRLKNGSVLHLSTEEEAKRVANEVEEIIFLGDILFNYGDFSESGHSLVPVGYCSEWWAREVEKSILTLYGEVDWEKAAAALSPPIDKNKIGAETLREWVENPLKSTPNFEEALLLSKTFQVPLHSHYLFYWKLVSGEDILHLCKYLSSGKLKIDEQGLQKIVLSYFSSDEIHKKAKRTLEHLGIPHQIINKENLVLERQETQVLAFCFNFHNPKELEELGRLDLEEIQNKSGLEAINSLCPSLLFRDKAGTFIGARMGRPEKAKMRELTGSPQVMFPVGEEGDRLRSFQSAIIAGKVTSDFPLFYCQSCHRSMIYPLCEECEQKCIKHYYCRTCGDLDKEDCRHGKAKSYKKQELDIRYYFEKAKSRIGDKVYPELIKGVRGTSNKNHYVEHLVKGLLRAKHNIYVNKEGTTRYDATELPLTHFKPKEVKTSVEKLRGLGYISDIYGKELVHEDQLLELKPQDIVLPGFNSLDESAAQVFTRVANFIDELLIKFYKLKPFYKIKKDEDLVGHLLIGLAPHISAGTIGRIIGFSENQGFMAHPMFHAGLRRDCVHPNTRFVYKNRCGELKVEEIGAFIENSISKGAKTKKIDLVGTVSVELPEPLKAISVDPHTKKITERGIKYFIKGPEPSHWIKITTATNRTMMITPNHDFLYLKDKKFKFKKAYEINLGDQVALINCLPPGESSQKLDVISLFAEHLPEKAAANISVLAEPFFKSLIEKNGIKNLQQLVNIKYPYRWCRQTPFLDVKKLLLEKVILPKELAEAKLKVKFSNRRHDSVLAVTKELACLLGYYAAEGYSRQSKTVSQVAFRINDPQIQTALIKSIKKVFNLKPHLGESNTKITVCDQYIYNLFKYVFKAGSNAYDKCVPNLIINSPENVQWSYLSAFLDGDGSVIPQNNSIVLYSVNRKLLDNFALLLAKYGIFSRYSTTTERLPGKTVEEIYLRLGKKPKKHVLHHLVIRGKDAFKMKDYLKLQSLSKIKKLTKLTPVNIRKVSFNKKEYALEQEQDIIIDFVKKIERVDDKQNSYCFEVEWDTKEERNVLWGEQIINTRCDGDEACAMLLMDALLNFSRQYLPETRGAKTMDAPLVLTSILDPKEVDEQVLEMDVAWKYPLELYEAALEMKKPGEVKDAAGKKLIPQLADRLGTIQQYESFGFTHSTDNFNHGVLCSAYKTLPSMEEKLFGQMEIAKKVRAVDMDDVAKLVIQKHFLKDIKGNLKKFSMQQFRCVKCNDKFRRPPLSGKCTCGGKLIFTITEGSVIKYLGSSLVLAEKYTFSPYLKQTLELLKTNVDHVFGKDKDKQAGLGAFISGVK